MVTGNCLEQNLVVPILLAIVGSSGARLVVRDGERHEDLVKQLRPKSGQPLHFTLEADPAHEYIPYREVPYKSGLHLLAHCGRKVKG